MEKIEKSDFYYVDDIRDLDEKKQREINALLNRIEGSAIEFDVFKKDYLDFDGYKCSCILEKRGPELNVISASGQ